MKKSKHDEEETNSAEQCFIQHLNRIEDEYSSELYDGLERRGIRASLADFLNCDHQLFQTPSELPLEHAKRLEQLVIETIGCRCEKLTHWAKRLPIFDSLTFVDQSSSIHANVLDLIVLECVWDTYVSAQPPSLPHTDLVIHRELRVSREKCSLSAFVDLYDNIFALVSTMSHLRLTRDEYVCLKALCLVKSNLGVTQFEKVAELRRHCLSALHKTSASAVANSPDANEAAAAAFRCDQLLMTLVDIKSISVRLMTYIMKAQSISGRTLLASSPSICEDRREPHVPDVISDNMVEKKEAEDNNNNNNTNNPTNNNNDDSNTIAESAVFADQPKASSPDQ